LLATELNIFGLVAKKTGAPNSLLKLNPVSFNKGIKVWKTSKKSGRYLGYPHISTLS